jgi:hypothetical protein
MNKVLRDGEVVVVKNRGERDVLNEKKWLYLCFIKKSGNRDSEDTSP